MTFSVVQQQDLKSLNTLALPASAEYFARIESVPDLQQAIQWANEKQLQITLLGGGSNIVLASDIPGLVLKVAINGVELISEDDRQVLIRVGAGEDWPRLVEYTLDNNWYGLENLSLIPGCVGAAPVQNIGAYGVELAKRLHSVEVVCLENGTARVLSGDECEFGYRDSIFKRELRGKVAITSVTLSLSKKPDLVLTYPALQMAAGEVSGQNLTPKKISELVCEIRRSKLPDPVSTPNAGSFFKNPVISSTQAKTLRGKFPDMVQYPVSAVEVKLAAGWLIEKAGWKGRQIGDIAVHDRQALVLVNRGDGTGQQLLDVAGQIVDSVKQEFGVKLEMEPRILPEV
ncbi:UDP-N-acetylmuramate dehydrogenase [Porticoccaceae bacterium LTM1]|nr:UDP-N-acetylmuramate dehydrogenase [Porticoccaceae bacterium LTM1]